MNTPYKHFSASQSQDPSNEKQACLLYSHPVALGIHQAGSRVCAFGGGSAEASSMLLQVRISEAENQAQQRDRGAKSRLRRGQLPEAQLAANLCATQWLRGGCPTNIFQLIPRAQTHGMNCALVRDKNCNVLPISYVGIGRPLRLHETAIFYNSMLKCGGISHDLAGFSPACLR